ncbi:hypothetical protein C7974DRAFT_387665 [Boeremia exigua]|uniref:uncharacterized protein n=1 Tax=Boeremia exigua TaxID=749465 RepID=UPI001E8EDC2C|nr:uncharacterized protein C7974DRAFT_387665 [Boeremia exigua]KAH6638990.1 hypothetical protein C7974DRAFT_387665 [Boeremia exigua]
MSSRCSSNAQSLASSVNVTALLYEQYQNAPKDDWDRLLKCWGISDCGDCHRSKGSCGWCPISSTCLPLPTDRLSRAFPLLTPVRYKGICAVGSERFELRTSGLGCQVSTITFLTAIVTIFATIFGLLVIYGLTIVGKWLYLVSQGSNNGWVQYADGTGEVWIRKESWGKWWRRTIGRQKESEIEEVDEGTNEIGWNWWRMAKRSINGSADEGRVRLE